MLGVLHFYAGDLVTAEHRATVLEGGMVMATNEADTIAYYHDQEFLETINREQTVYSDFLTNHYLVAEIPQLHDNIFILRMTHIKRSKIQRATMGFVRFIDIPYYRFENVAPTKFMMEHKPSDVKLLKLSETFYCLMSNDTYCETLAACGANDVRKENVVTVCLKRKIKDALIHEAFYQLAKRRVAAVPPTTTSPAIAAVVGGVSVVASLGALRFLTKKRL